MGDNKNELFSDFDFESLDGSQFIDIGDTTFTKKDGNDDESIEIIDDELEGDEPEGKKKDNKVVDEEEDFIELEDSEEDEETQTKGAPKHKVDSSPILPLASALHEKGLLSSFNQEEFDKKVSEEYDGDAYEALFDYIDEEINKRSDFIHSSLNAEQREYLNALASGIPTNFYANAKANQVKYESITEDTLSEDEDLQESVMREYLKATTKFSDTKIDKLIKDKKDLGDLLDESVEAVSELRELSKNQIANAKKEQERLEQEAAENNRKQLEQIKKNIEETTEILGFKLNKKLQDTIYKSLTTPVTKTPDGTYLNALAAKRAENPVEFEKKLHFLFHITKGFEDFTTLKKPVKTTAIQELKDALDGKKNTAFKTGKATSSNKHNIDFDDKSYFGELSKLMTKM